ncbi:hypothetical protein HYH03_002060 [Edaphochlamys debaryana]|uniref:N-acetyltransferase domain-containing protein n=1 Tax=Edaphochlamys debaryana TaxID=47281 RepID=A0A835YEI8_9CHLO|nr:hypothetical protein HYH03_002060 [Edaphochlamys debaryana]|eukprot:KAG2499763.1 hypothetical protein HYH03_002060 [Edaphochlamys debaryana]
MADPQTTPVRILSVDSDPGATAVVKATIAKAFVLEPNNDFFCADPAQNEARWLAIADLVLAGNPSAPWLHVLGSGEEAVAVAYPYPEHKAPEDAPPPPGVMEVMQASARPEAGPVREQFMAYLGDKKAAFHQEHGPFMYLSFLAVRPEWQGKGLGSRLLRHLSDKADAAGRWMYLEATTPDNQRLYERHGFVALETKVWTDPALPGQRVMLIPMGRPPQPPKQPKQQ